MALTDMYEKLIKLYILNLKKTYFNNLKKIQLCRPHLPPKNTCVCHKKEEHKIVEY